MALTLAGPANSTILFRPVGNGPEVFAFNGVPMTQPLDNPNALNSSKVYFIFGGPNWVQNGAPATALNNMVEAAQTIMNSSYLSGIRQYGSDGLASYGGFTVDPNYDPVLNPIPNPGGTEIEKVLSNPTFSSWLPPGPDARTSPIYVVVRYKYNGANVGGVMAVRIGMDRTMRQHALSTQSM